MKNPKDEPSILKNWASYAVLVSQAEAKSPFLPIFNFWNLNQVLRFRLNFHVSSVLIYVQIVYSNIGSKTTPSLFFQGAGLLFLKLVLLDNE